MDLTVITTYRCNSRCSMCHIWKYPTKPAEEVDAEVLRELPGGFDNLNITGGEPTLRTDLADLVDVLYPKCRILEISSNGLHPERLEPIIRKRPNIKVRFSLEGFDDRNNLIRGETDGFRKKVEGLMRLKEAGGTDLGFGSVIQDDNIDQIVDLYRFAQERDVEYATSTLHNAFQFHKNDNVMYDRVRVAKEVEKLIAEMLRSNSIKNWFRAYLNLGLIENILGHDRLIPCTAATDFAFIDPWCDVYACNVRPDLWMGNLRKQSWEEIMDSPKADEIRAKVRTCTQNCWMVTTARTAMRNPRAPQLPKARPFWWVVANKLRVSLGMPIPFDKYIDYATFVKDESAVKREFHLDDKPAKRIVQNADDEHYTFVGPYFNR
ncbi:MAG TPA: radical SAM protein [Candidatus Hydrogenedentes bacterium]|nr:radical SAM protein [Candidatus Hydrogenedentota bacterium]